MSLDLNLKSKTKRQRKGTGVFVRENGKNKELQTIEEVKAHFPDMDLSKIEEREYETDIIFKMNITNNLAKMAKEIPCNGNTKTLYDMLWMPEEHNMTHVTWEYQVCIVDSLEHMLMHRNWLKNFNPTNGWGDYETLLEFVFELSKALSEWDGYEEIEIVASK